MSQWARDALYWVGMMMLMAEMPLAAAVPMFAATAFFYHLDRDVRRGMRRVAESTHGDKLEHYTKTL